MQLILLKKLMNQELNFKIILLILFLIIIFKIKKKEIKFENFTLLAFKFTGYSGPGKLN